MSIITKNFKFVTPDYETTLYYRTIDLSLVLPKAQVCHKTVRDNLSGFPEGNTNILLIIHSGEFCGFATSSPLTLHPNSPLGRIYRSDAYHKESYDDNLCIILHQRYQNIDLERSVIISFQVEESDTIELDFILLPEIPPTTNAPPKLSIFGWRIW